MLRLELIKILNDAGITHLDPDADELDPEEFQSDLEKALQMSAKTLEAEPLNATFLDTYAWILFRMKKYKEQSLARFSNIYMLAGMLLGVAVFYFLVMPEIKQDYQEKLREMEASYNQTISTKNNEIENLRLEKDALSSKNSDYEDTQVTLQTTIDNLASEVEILKKTVENGGMSVPDSITTDTASVTNATQVTVTEVNEAAQRNNENVIGISTTSVEDIITHE